MELLNSDKKKTTTNHTPLIAGIVAGIAFIILVAIVILLIVYKRKRNNSNLSITFHQKEEFLTVQTVKFSPTGTHTKAGNRNFPNINYVPQNETDELIPHATEMNVQDDSSSDNGSTCDETKPVMKHQSSSSSGSIEC